jgi:hypothetical protein
MTEKAELTGQDIDLLKRALAIAVVAIERCPPQLRPEWSHLVMDELFGRLAESDDE